MARVCGLTTDYRTTCLKCFPPPPPFDNLSIPIFDNGESESMQPREMRP